MAIFVVAFAFAAAAVAAFGHGIEILTGFRVAGPERTCTDGQGLLAYEMARISEVCFVYARR